MTKLYPAFPRQSVDALGIKTSFVSAGDRSRQPLLLLHGMTSSGDWYRELMVELADEFWLIAPDLPGFGYSDNTMPYTFPHLIEWLAAFSDVLDLPPLMVAGHSFGGSLATNYTLTYPEDVTRLLLIAPAVLASKLFPHYLTRAGINLGLVDLGTVVSQSRAVVGQQVKLSYYEPEKYDDALWERRILEYDLARASADVIKAVAFQDVREQLHNVSQPVCIVWGADDPVLPVTQAQELEELIPHAKALVLDECGHNPVAEQPAKTQAIARAFAKGEDVEVALAAVPPPPAARPTIAVFGSSAPRSGDAAYEEARQIGRLLAEEGFNVATGGYSGTMTAVSQGASEAGGHVIGVTCDQIEQFRPLGPNEWIVEETRYRTLQERLLHLVERNAGMIVLPGGIGTLSEMALAWSFVQVGEIEPRPLCLLGPVWRETIAVFSKTGVIRDDHLRLLHFADTPEEAVTYVAARVKIS